MKNIILPQWTEKYSKSEGGRDHLAYESVGLEMLERLLPGISTITKRARYYSFFPWVLFRFFKSSSPKTYRDFRRYLKTKSLSFLYANGLLHTNEYGTGIDGIDAVRDNLKGGQKEKYSWSEKDVKEFRDNYWIYSQKLSQMGIIAENVDYKLESLTAPRGKELAETFEESIKETQYFKKYCDKDDLEIPSSVLKEYGRTGGILELKNYPREQNLLLETFFRLNDVRNERREPVFYYISETSVGFPRARRESLFLYLDIINQYKGKFEEDDLRRIQYFSKVQNSLYRPRKKLSHTLEFWRMFQARQYFVYAIEAIFRGVTTMIENFPMTFDDLTEEIFRAVDFQIIKNDFRLSIRENTKLKDVLGQIGRGKAGEVFDRLCTLGSRLNEERLYQTIRSNLDNRNYNYFFVYPLLLLCLLYLRLNYYRKNSLPFWEFGKIGREVHLSMDNFFATLELKNNATVREFLSFIIKEYIVMQHLYVATAKFAARQIDTYHFFDEGGILKGIRRADVNMNTPKFWNALNILSDLGLITTEGNKYTLTKKGKELLTKL